MKTNSGPPNRIPNPEENKRMHTEYCDAHDRNSDLCTRLLRAHAARAGKELRL